MQYPMFQGVRVGNDAGDNSVIIPTFWRQLIRNPVAENIFSGIRELAMHWTYLYNDKAGSTWAIITGR